MILLLLISVTLIGCRTSGVKRVPIALNPVPGDVRAIFNRKPPVPAGPLKRSETVRYTGQLIIEIHQRNRAGRRLIYQIDRARRFHRR